VVLLKENHMQLTEATTLDRKSGEAEGSAVRPSGASPALGSHEIVILSERLTDYQSETTFRRVVEEPVLSVVEGTSAMPTYPCCWELFNHRSPYLAGPGVPRDLRLLVLTNTRTADRPADTT
jgi:hypothetical protein